MDTIIFQIRQYTDGTYRIETSHFHYHFAEGLSADDVKAKDLGDTMFKIAEIVNNKYDHACVFEVV